MFFLSEMVGGLLSSEADEEGARGRAVARASRARVSTTACELSQALRECRRALAAVVEAGRRSLEPGAAREVAEWKPSTWCEVAVEGADVAPVAVTKQGEREVTAVCAAEAPLLRGAAELPWRECVMAPEVAEAARETEEAAREAEEAARLGQVRRLSRPQATAEAESRDEMTAWEWAEEAAARRRNAEPAKERHKARLEHEVETALPAGDDLAAKLAQEAEAHVAATGAPQRGHGEALAAAEEAVALAQVRAVVSSAAQEDHAQTQAAAAAAEEEHTGCRAAKGNVWAAREAALEAREAAAATSRRTWRRRESPWRQGLGRQGLGRRRREVQDEVAGARARPTEAARAAPTEPWGKDRGGADSPARGGAVARLGGSRRPTRTAGGAPRGQQTVGDDRTARLAQEAAAHEETTDALQRGHGEMPAAAEEAVALARAVRAVVSAAAQEDHAQAQAAAAAAEEEHDGPRALIGETPGSAAARGQTVAPQATNGLREE